MFRRYPYWFLLLGGLLAWIAAAGYHFFLQREQAPERLAARISRDIGSRQAALDELFRRHDPVLRRLGAGSPTDQDVALLFAQPFYCYYYIGDSLLFWNNNLVLPERPPAAYSAAGALAQEDESSFFARRTDLGNGHSLLVFFPLETVYPFENEYLRSYFPASAGIPKGTLLAARPLTARAAPIFAGGRRIGYLNISDDGPEPQAPDGRVILLCSIGTCLLFLWLQWLCLHLSDRKRYGVIGILLLGVVLLRGLFYFTGLPLDLDEGHLFSPQLYASNALLPSLGDVLINGILLLSCCLLALSRFPFADRLRRVRRTDIRIALGLLFALLTLFIACFLVRTGISIVQDSNIYFDLRHLYSLNGDTACGLITICILATNVLAIIHLGRFLFRLLFPTPWHKYPFLAVSALLLFLLQAGAADSQGCLIFLLWFLAVTLLLDLPRLRASPDPFSVSTLFWTFFLCASAAVLLEQLNQERERETRKKFARQLITRQDDAMEWSFNAIRRNMEADSALRSYLHHASPPLRDRISDRFNSRYLNSQLNDYQTRLYFFDTAGNGLYNADTQSYASLRQRLAGSAPTPTPGLYYTDNAPDEHYYIAEIRVTDTQGHPAGYLFIDLAQKKAEGETVFPELLQPARVNRSQKDAGYSYAVYANRRLITQSNDYPFPFYLTGDSARQAAFEWRSYSEISMLTYHAGSNKEVIVARATDEWQELLTLFSYLFGLQLLLVLLVFLVRVTGRWGSNSRARRAIMTFTLRRRVQLSMLGIVLFSFLIIAVTTIAFFRQRYDRNNRKNVQSLTQRIERAIQQYLKDEYRKGANDIAVITRSPAFRHFIVELARSQKADINLFDLHGRLLTASQNDIFEKGLLAPLLQPVAFRQLSGGGRFLLIRNERFGRLDYVSSYVPLRREDSRIEGFINIPLFSVQQELDAQIADILVALINLYAFIFLLCSLLAVAATGWLTRTLNVIIRQFERLNLQRNELLAWPYDDEIGLLVREYNKMVRKVEEQAARLASSEREDAWREMAQQVAHEIKNPLTPMKLNIQYLQNALSSNRPDIHELAGRVSRSIIEQIDNLSYIASEFSDFAKMPGARAEVIVLNELLEKAAALHQSKPGIRLELHQPEAELRVLADRSQLLRVFTNLLQNAVQAVPADRGGMIRLTAAVQENEVQISLSDNGEGIPRELAGKIFNPYFTTKTSGTGLGLAMSRKIIELWKGRIWFDSEEGKGTTFFIRLPYYPGAGR